jgi:DUF4097 and DUF4098 domain-containing protein YvlB
MNATTMNALKFDRRSAFIGAIIGTLLGCALVWGGEAKVTEELHQTYPLTEGGRVSLDNVNGNVRITTWDRAEVKLDAVKSAKSDADLKAVEIVIDAKADRVRVQTKHPRQTGWLGRKGNSTSVEYTLVVPRSARLDKVENVNGNIELEGVAGDVSATTVNGRLTAKKMGGQTDLSSVNGSVTASLSPAGSIKAAKLKSVNGSIDLSLPAKAGAQLKANTVNGGIKSDFDLPVKKHFPIGQNLDVTLGEGGAVIKAETVNGGIRVNRASAM